MMVMFIFIMQSNFGLCNTIKDVEISKHRKEISHVLKKYISLSKEENKNLTELLLFTVAVESDFSDERGNTWFQIQKKTERYIMNKQDKNLRVKLQKLQTKNENHYYMVVAGLYWVYHLDKNKIKIPKHSDRYTQAVLWKKYYNTAAGKGTVKGAYKKGTKYLG